MAKHQAKDYGMSNINTENQIESFQRTQYSFKVAKPSPYGLMYMYLPQKRIIHFGHGLRRRFYLEARIRFL